MGVLYGHTGCRELAVVFAYKTGILTPRGLGGGGIVVVYGRVLSDVRL